MSESYGFGGMAKYATGLKMGGQNSSQGFNNNNDVAAESFNYQPPAFNYSPTAGSYDPMSGYGSALMTPAFAGGAAPKGMFDSLSGFMNSDTGKFLFGSKNADGSSLNGAMPSILGLGQGLFNGYMGMKAYGQGKRLLDSQEKFANANLANTAKTLNTAMGDKAAAQYAASGGKSETPESYMQRNGLRTA